MMYGLIRQIGENRIVTHKLRTNRKATDSGSPDELSPQHLRTLSVSLLTSDISFFKINPAGELTIFLSFFLTK